MKVICVWDQGFVWEVPLHVIANHRAQYYTNIDPDITFQEEFDHVMENDDVGIDWIQSNMDWEDCSEHAILVEKPEVPSCPGHNAEYSIECK